MRLLRGETTQALSQAPRRDGIDFAVHTNPDAEVTVSDDVRTYCTERRCRGMPRVITHPETLREPIRTTLRPGVRAMVGNAGCELTFRHLTSQPAKNVLAMLHWAEAAYELVGHPLVLAPMDYDLIHDVMTGGRLLEWAARHRVPLAIFCGYRFLFQEDAFEHMREVCRHHPMKYFRNPYHYPYQEISEAIRTSGAEVWIGAGSHEGLAAGVLEKAEKFGLAAVFTSRDAWAEIGG